MITALATIFVFGLIVFIHELGHFITAKMSGMQVDEFAIGFGPAIFKVQKGETLYSIRIIPLGGFNRIAGMTPDEPLNERSFYNKPAWKKFIVISAGAVFNFILAIVLFFGLNVTVGNLTYTNEPVIGNIIAGSSAEQAHLEANDRIITIDGKKISTWDDIRPSLQGTANHGVTVVVEREGQTIETTVIPKMEQDSPKIGIYPSFTRETYSIGESLSLAVSRTGQTIVAMVSGIYDMIRGTQAAELSGPVGISQMAGTIAQSGFAPLLSFAAFLSINLGVINLLPLPVLDGGHLIIILAEAITGRRLPAKALLYIQMVGVALMVALFLYVTTQDIFRLL